MKKFYKWLRTPMTDYEKLVGVIIWFLLIISLVFWEYLPVMK